jgi:iron complex transport system substrate-binding protein
LLPAALGALLLPSAAEARPLRAMALDQCADQYLLELRPDADLLLSPRADDPDAWHRTAAKNRPRSRPTLEAAIVFQPDVVVRYWGGEPRLLDRLASEGVKVAVIEDATTFEGIRRNIRIVATALQAPERGEAVIARMDDRLRTASVQTRTPRPRALYLTAGGFTAGRGTLVDAILSAGGLTNAATRPFFGPVGLERIALVPPALFVLGFFDQVRGDWRGPGRHPVVRQAASGRVAARLPAATLTCPAWFAADAAVLIAEGAR